MLHETAPSPRDVFASCFVEWRMYLMVVFVGGVSYGGIVDPCYLELRRVYRQECNDGVRLSICWGWSRRLVLLRGSVLTYWVVL